MSGYFGFVHFDGSPVDAALAAKMLDFIHWRGFDGDGLYNDGVAVLGHVLHRTTRSAEHERQPFTLAGLTIAAAAVLYDRANLRAALDAAPILTPDGGSLPPTHETTADSELLIRAYLKWGESLSDHVMGDYTFALWNPAAQCMTLMRDPIGTLGLYYARVGGVLVFSNDLDTLRLHPAVPDTLDDLAVGGFLILGSQTRVDHSATIYQAIRRLPAAHQLTATANTNTVRRVWSLPLDPPLLRRPKLDDFAAEYLDLLTTAVRDRMDSPRTVIALSGGLDSGTIVALATGLVERGDVNTELSAITAVFDRIHPDTEAYYAGLTAQAYGIPHTLFPRDAYQIREPLPVSSEPSQSYTAEATEDYTRTIAALAPVYFSGDGSDEILYHTPLYQVMGRLSPGEAFDLYRYLWRAGGKRPALGGVLEAVKARLRRTPVRQEYDFPNWLNPDFAAENRLHETFTDFWNTQSTSEHRWQPIAYASIMKYNWQRDHQLGSHRQHPLPRMTVPFLDLRLIRFAMQLPFFNWNSKLLLRMAARDLLPPEVLHRPKTPLGQLLPRLLRQPGVEWIDHWEAVPELARYVRREAVPSIVGHPLKPNPPNQFVNIRPLLLNHWLKNRSRPHVS
ncbi:MAG: asparagine synthase-related protein [bacterium]|nr:asparagine synthase-related protein [bacterium]